MCGDGVVGEFVEFGRVVLGVESGRVDGGVGGLGVVDD